MELDSKANILRTNKECDIAMNGSERPILGNSLFNFVADSDVDRLREQLISCSHTDKATVIGVLIKGRGSPVELRIRRQLIGKDIGYLAVLLNSAADSGALAPRRPGEQSPMSFEDLSTSLNRAYTLSSVVQLVGEFCSVALASPEGMIFVEHEGKPHLVWQWQTNQDAKAHMTEVLTKAVVIQAFRSGNPVLVTRSNKSHSDISFYLQRAFLSSKNAGLMVFPIGVPGEPPVGVVTMALLHQDTLNSEFRHYLRRLAELVSGCITRARAYDEALAARLEAQYANRRKEEFLSVLSHELKSPLAPILGWAVALSSGAISSEKQSMAIEGIIRNARAMNYLIVDLFDAASISSGKLRLDVSIMRLQEVVREALTAIQPAAENKKLRISTDISEAIPPFLADPRRVRQVLINLLNNAVKFTPNGGSVALRVLKRGRTVQCSVSDSGRGIDPKFLPFVFDRFRQESRSDNSKDTGLGLGLTIVKQIAELHGGKVKAHSLGPDHGATFTIHLPIRTHKATAGK